MVHFVHFTGIILPLPSTNASVSVWSIFVGILLFSAAARLEGVLITDWHLRHVQTHQLQTLLEEYPDLTHRLPELMTHSETVFKDVMVGDSGGVVNDNSFLELFKTFNISRGATEPAVPGADYSTSTNIIELSVELSATPHTEQSVAAHSGPPVAVAIHSSCVPLLQELVRLEGEYSAAVRDCRGKDGDRGRSVLPDYDVVNAVGGGSGRDGVVTRAECRAAIIASITQALT